jgi:hypothetical protein
VTGVTPEEQQEIAGALNCKLGAYPIRYLGMPVSDKRLSVADWSFLTEKVSTGWIRGRDCSWHQRDALN